MASVNKLDISNYAEMEKITLFARLTCEHNTKYYTCISVKLESQKTQIRSPAFASSLVLTR